MVLNSNKNKHTSASGNRRAATTTFSANTQQSVLRRAPSNLTFTFIQTDNRNAVHQFPVARRISGQVRLGASATTRTALMRVRVFAAHGVSLRATLGLLLVASCCTTCCNDCLGLLCCESVIMNLIASARQSWLLAFFRLLFLFLFLAFRHSDTSAIIA